VWSPPLALFGWRANTQRLRRQKNCHNLQAHFYFVLLASLQAMTWSHGPAEIGRALNLLRYGHNACPVGGAMIVSCVLGTLPLPLLQVGPNVLLLNALCAIRLAQTNFGRPL